MSGGGYTAAMQPARTAALAELIAEIGRQDAAGRDWRLTPEDLQRLLGLTPEQYYRELYGAQVAGHPLISLAQADESFSQASILPLVSLLEHLCGAGTVAALERAGIFFSREQQAEITAQFLNAAAREVGAHRFRTDEFTAMLRTFGNLSQARQVYLQHFFDLESLRRRAASRYCARRGFAIPGLALRNAEGILRFLFSKHVLRAETIFGSLSGAFLAAAARAEPATRGAASRRRPLPARAVGTGAVAALRLDGEGRRGEGAHPGVGIPCL